MKLQEYNRKRNFLQTAEPAGKVGKTSSHLYLIQKHAASRLHYDFRLALDGVLKSWAVPKGPSLNPGDKRLAVHVEDHPLDYGSFEGIIPKGQYGGGTVMMWDRGEWEPEGDPRRGYEKGHLRFALKGQRLKGSWALIRMGDRNSEDGKNWLLVKEKDGSSDSSRSLVNEFTTSVITRRSMDEIAEQAPSRKKEQWQSNKTEKKAKAGGRPKSSAAKLKKSPFPASFKPQLATLVNEVPAGEDWIHEVKYDGYRLLAFINAGKIRLMTRRGQDWTRRFSSIEKSLKELKIESAILDGEVVIQKPDGTTDFQALQNALKEGRRGNPIYYVFDLPYLNGVDLTQTPLSDRKSLLSDVIGATDPKGNVRYSGHIEGKGEAIFKNACHYALEGIISKRAAGFYSQRRTDDWVKVKCAHRQEFIIGGYTKPKGGRRHFGSLLIGYHDPQGNLIYSGHVGTGFSNATLQSLFKDLSKRERKESPFHSAIEDTLRREVVWVKPDLVAEIQFAGWTNEGVLRQPSFEGLREDKKPSEITIERPKPVNEADKIPPTNKNPSPQESEPAQKSRDVVAGVALSHPDRVLYPEQNVTKKDLALYYEAVSKWMIPHIKGRPLSLVRCPRGEGQACFYQKHLTEMTPDAVRGIDIQEKNSQGTYIVVDDLEGLVSLVQLGVLEFHPWPCADKNIERPDRLIFDLDPAPGVKMPELVSAARLVRDQLADLGLTSFLKTTGGKGLHVVAPVQPTAPWAEFRQFAEDVAAAIVREKPESYVATMSKAKRTGKIFIDFFRNNRGSTSVAPYSSRAKKGATVSMPLSWDELSVSLKMDDFTIKTVPAFLKERGEAWRGFFNVRQKINLKSIKRGKDHASR